MGDAAREAVGREFCKRLGCDPDRWQVYERSVDKLIAAYESALTPDDLRRLAGKFGVVVAGIDPAPNGDEAVWHDLETGMTFRRAAAKGEGDDG